MIFRKAAKEDVPAIVYMIADDKLGKTREDIQIPILKEYFVAFENINQDDNQELIVAEDESSEIFRTLQFLIMV